MPSIGELVPEDETPLAEFAAFLNALGEALEPTHRAFIAACESPAAHRAAQVVNALPLVVDALLVAMLTPTPAVDEDAWYCECVEYALAQSSVVSSSRLTSQDS